jgi:steroid delta-isomerase-like uncharacterized protein
MPDTTRVEQSVEAFNRADEAYFDLYTDDVTVHGLPSGGAVDKQGMMDFYRALWSAFADLRVEPVEMIADRDLLAVRLYVKGTHRGEIMGVAPSGNEIDVEEMTIFKLDDEGRCTERWIRMDELSFMQQIGAMPTPAASSA